MNAQFEAYDLTISKGRVIDPATSTDAIRDVGVRDRILAAIEPSLAAATAEQNIDATGLLVTPGLIDLHVHVYKEPRPTFRWTPM